MSSDLPYPNLGRLVVFWLLAVLLIPLLRAVSRAIGRRQGAYVQNVIIVGSGRVAHLLADKIAKHSEYGLRVVGFVDRDDRAFAGNGDDRGVELVGTTHDLPRLVREHAVHRVAIAFSTDSHDQTLGVIRSMQDSDVQIDIVPRMFEVLGTNAQLHTIEGIPLVGLPSTHLSGSSRFLKRLLDVSAATLGLVLLAPIFLVVSRTDQARLQGASLLPADPDGRRRPDVSRLQVSDDGRRRRKLRSPSLRI